MNKAEKLLERFARKNMLEWNQDSFKITHSWLHRSIIEAINEALLLGAVSGSLSFKEKMKQDIMPRVWQMAEKEKDHLNWLIDNNAPNEMIETSRKYLSHFRQRHKEYIEYADGL